MTEPNVQGDGVAPVRQRLHYLDNAKGLASLLGIFYHASLVYSCGWWWISSPPENRVPILGYCVNILSYFRMPLFMFVAGYFTAYGLKKYGSKGFFRHRSRRIGLPFLTSMIILLPFQHLLGGLFSDPENWRSSFFSKLNPLSTSFALSHLWFLYYLILYSIFVLFAWQFVKRLRISHWPSWLVTLFTTLHKNPWGVVACWFLVNLAFALVFYCMDRALATTHHAWFPLTDIGVLLPIFLFGLFSQAWSTRLNGWLDSHTSTFLIMVGVMIVFHYLRYDYLADLILNSYKAKMFFSILFKWVGTIAILGLISKSLNYQNPVMRYMSDSSYPVYLFHQPVIILLAFIIVSLLPGIHPVAGYLLLCLLAIIMTYGANEVFIRRWSLGRFLFTGAGK